MMGQENLFELRDFYRTSQLILGVNTTVKKGEVVSVYDEDQPRGLWRLGRILSTIKGTDGNVKGVRVLVLSKKSRTMIIQ